MFKTRSPVRSVLTQTKHSLKSTCCVECCFVFFFKHTFKFKRKQKDTNIQPCIRKYIPDLLRRLKKRARVICTVILWCSEHAYRCHRMQSSITPKFLFLIIFYVYSEYFMANGSRGRFLKHPILATFYLTLWFNVPESMEGIELVLEENVTLCTWVKNHKHVPPFQKKPSSEFSSKAAQALKKQNKTPFPRNALHTFIHTNSSFYLVITPTAIYILFPFELLSSADWNERKTDPKICTTTNNPAQAAQALHSTLINKGPYCN